MRLSLGLSFVEIGEISGEQPSTIQVRLSRIMPKLQRCLRSKGIAR
jgi:DNA-directed RNA polymerase specialized sigma24 family protein